VLLARESELLSKRIYDDRLSNHAIPLGLAAEANLQSLPASDVDAELKTEAPRRMTLSEHAYDLYDGLIYCLKRPSIFALIIFESVFWTVASMLLILLVGPNLISQDLRFNALPLYLSRPLRRIDYFAGKLGVITAFLGMIVIVPSVIAYILGLLFSLDITILKDTIGVLFRAVIYGLVISVSAGMLILEPADLRPRERRRPWGFSATTR
jgi:hypothetical protein